MFTFISVYQFDPPTVTVSKSVELSFWYSTEWEQVPIQQAHHTVCQPVEWLCPLIRKALLHSFCCHPGMVFDRINIAQLLISKQRLLFQMADMIELIPLILLPSPCNTSGELFEVIYVWFFSLVLFCYCLLYHILCCDGLTAFLVLLFWVSQSFSFCL